MVNYISDAICIYYSLVLVGERNVKFYYINALTHRNHQLCLEGMFTLSFKNSAVMAFHSAWSLLDKLKKWVDKGREWKSSSAFPTVSYSHSGFLPVLMYKTLLVQVFYT